MYAYDTQTKLTAKLGLIIILKSVFAGIIDNDCGSEILIPKIINTTMRPTLTRVDES